MTDALTNSFERLSKSVPRALFGYRLDAADAEDMLQEAVASVLAGDREIRDVEGYLIASARNKARKNVRRPVADAVVLMESPPETSVDWEDAALDRILYSDAFAGLRDADKEILVAALDGVDGWPDRLRKRLQRARQRLETRIGALSAAAWRVGRRALEVSPECCAAALTVGSFAVAAVVPAGRPAPTVVHVAAEASAPDRPAPGASPPTEPVERALVARSSRQPSVAAPPPAAETSPPKPATLASVPTPTGAATITNHDGGGQNRLACIRNSLIDQCVDYPNLRQP